MVKCPFHIYFTSYAHLATFSQTPQVRAVRLTFHLTPRSTHLSFSLSFFVHGESIVCASVDVRQHPPVRQLTRRHLLLAQQSNHGIPGTAEGQLVPSVIALLSYPITDLLACYNY